MDHDDKKKRDRAGSSSSVPPTTVPEGHIVAGGYHRVTSHLAVSRVGNFPRLQTSIPLLINVVIRKNNFQWYGPTFIKILEDSRFNGDKRIHYFQREAVLKTLKMVERDDPTKNCKPILVCAPPAAGKTGIITLLPYAIQPAKVLVMTPSRILSHQIAETLGYFKGRKSFLETTGLVNDPTEVQSTLVSVSLIEDKLDPMVNLTDLVIINAQKFGGNCDTTLSLEYGNKKKLEDVKSFIAEFDLLIVDEAQHYPAETWRNTVQAFFFRCRPNQRKNAIFLTATPTRGDGSPILGDAQKDRIAFSITLGQLEGKIVRRVEFIEEGSLEDSDVLPETRFRTVYRAILHHLSDQTRLEPRFKPQAMIIVRTLKEAQQWASELNKLGGSEFALAILGDKNGQRLTDDFTTKDDHTVAVICNLLKEGYSNPKVTLCVILRNIRSRVLFDQFVGRCMRLNRSVQGAEEGDVDKSKGIVLSFTDFGQAKMWKERLSLAEDDPFDEGMEGAPATTSSTTRQDDRCKKRLKRNDVK